MRAEGRRGLAVCMAVTLILSGITVSAEETLGEGSTDAVENAATVSGGDTDGDEERPGEAEDAGEENLENIGESLAEEQIMSLAADDIAGDADGGITWVIDADGKLTVEGTGNLSGEHASDNFAWRPYSLQITSAEINVSGMTDASYLFYGCENMSSIDVSGFDTANVNNMNRMFSGCGNLTGVDVSGFNTGNVMDMGWMFDGCSSLMDLDLSGFDTSNVTNMGCMFNGCGRLINLNVSGFDTSNAIHMGGMFWGCSGLTNLDISNFTTAGVTDMGHMFEDCNSLKSLDISGFDTRSAVSMIQMFSGCSALTSLDVGGFYTGNVSSMSGMFSGCSGLTNLDVSSFDTGNVMNMEQMFYGCSGLTSLDVGGFDTGNVVNMSGMFWDCSSLTSLDMGSFDTANARYMAWMLKNCDSLTVIHSPSHVVSAVSLPSVPGTVWYLPDRSEVTELPQGLSDSVLLTRSDFPTAPEIITTTPDLNMEDVVRVKYVPYSYTVETSNTDPNNRVTFSIVEGKLAEGLQMYPATGEIYGVPLETGAFKIRVMAAYSNPAYLPSYAELMLTVLDNTDGNVGVATDPGYDITQPVTDFNMDAVSGEGTQTLVSQGEYEQFQHAVYIDGRKLTEGQEYTSESGSTRITILNQTLTADGTGTHTIGVEFRTEDGILKRAAQNYTIVSNDSETPPGDDKNDGDDENNTDNRPGDEEEPSVTPPVQNESNDSGNSNSNSDTGSILPAAEPRQQDFIIYTVERGDSLWKIAVKFYGQGSGWRRIYEDNAAAVRNPDRLYAGQKLVIRLSGPVNPMPEMPVVIPDAAVLEETSYRVQKGDRLWTIARRVYGSGMLWNVIYEANRDIMADPGRIRAGQVIKLPEGDRGQ